MSYDMVAQSIPIERKDSYKKSTPQIPEQKLSNNKILEIAVKIYIKSNGNKLS